MENWEDFDIRDYLDDELILRDLGDAEDFQQGSSEPLTYDKDFNLNSPIIITDIDFIIRKIRKCAMPIHQKIFPLDKIVDKFCNVPLVNIAEDFDVIHQTIFRDIITTPCGSIMNLGKAFLYELSELHTIDKLYHTIPRIFEDIVSRDNKNYAVYLSKFKSFTVRAQDDVTLSYVFGSSRFWSWVVNLLNAKKVSNMSKMISTLAETSSIKVDQGLDGSLDILLQEQKFVTIYSRYLYFHKSKLLINENLILMIKDIFLNRVNTFIVCSMGDPIYSNELLSNLLSLYSYNDLKIIVAGNKAYDSIKMIEPICNLRLSQLAEEGRDIPKITNFYEFVVREAQSWSNKYHFSSDPVLSLILNMTNPSDVGFCYGLYRHWGHPVIESFIGLEKLHSQVNCLTEINLEYVVKLADLLAFMLLRHHFMENHKWAVELNELPDNHFLRTHIMEGTWPSEGEVRSHRLEWSKLPLTKMFDIPKTLPLSDILDDKAHSLTRSQLQPYLLKNSIGPVTSRRVLLSTLSEETFDPIGFLSSIDSHGLPDDVLIIGLREKERELKSSGRFFALMSLPLRYYFVTTELLISHNVLPLFSSLTMKDTLNKTFKKMLKAVPGHNTNNTDMVTYSYHIDYEKWNNFQREEATKPIFEVLDKSFGFKKVISRTHEFFQKSLIYHAASPHLFRLDSQLRGYNLSPEHRVSWEGQKGGLEGLRQKGWSILSLLMILHESSSNRNTAVKVLAQGDNQVICPSYRISQSRIYDNKDEELKAISINASNLIKDISKGASNLGLLIKKDETWSSHSYLVYGKYLLFRTNLIQSEPKRWGRLNSSANDQIPTLSTMISNCCTTSLCVTQQSETIIKPILLYVIFSTSIILDYSLYNPVLGGEDRLLQDACNGSNSRELTLGKFLFIDSSLGGLGGSNLCRWLIRQFPDNITESLSFWKQVHDNSSMDRIKKFCLMACSVQEGKKDLSSFKRLLENPTSLNIIKPIDVANFMKDKVIEGMRSKISQIVNRHVRDILLNTMEGEDDFILFLSSITPMFPRFLSEFFSSTLFGYSSKILSLFQSSRTLRVYFRSRFTTAVSDKLKQIEIKNINLLLNRPHILKQVWKCSSEYADSLRFRTWSRQIYGCTVPHPFEYLTDSSCKGYDSTCVLHRDKSITVKVVNTPSRTPYTSGPLMPYLGSATSEQTALNKSWEKNTQYALVKGALALQKTINWFIDSHSNLSESLKNNLKSYTNAPVESIFSNLPKRSGSALHRFRSSRMSAGGFCSTSHNLCAYNYVTTDTLTGITEGSNNYDFLFQSSILYAQLLTCNKLVVQTNVENCYHVSWNCDLCLREIEEIKLEAPFVYEFFPSFPESPTLFIEQNLTPFRQVTAVVFPEYDPVCFSFNDKSYNIGVCQGFLLAGKTFSYRSESNVKEIFPSNIYNYLIPHDYLMGLLHGCIIGVFLDCSRHRFMFKLSYKDHEIRGHIINEIKRMFDNEALGIAMENPNISRFISERCILISPSYPSNLKSLSDSLSSYLVTLFTTSTIRSHYINIVSRKQLIFSEMQGFQLLSGFMSGISILKVHSSRSPNKRSILSSIRNSLSIIFQNSANSDQLAVLQPINIANLNITFVNQEVRHFCKNNMLQLDNTFYRDFIFGQEYLGKIQKVFITFSETPVPPQLLDSMSSWVNYFCPIISGYRLVQIASGSHYKLKCIFKGLTLSDKCLVLGDGSGSISSYILRKYPNAKVFFNSLFSTVNLQGYGNKPGLPSSLNILSVHQLARCVNRQECWQQLSDLRYSSTWSEFSHFTCDDWHTIVYDGNIIIEYDYIKFITNLFNFVKAGKTEVIIIRFFIHLLKEEMIYKYLSLICGFYKNAYFCNTEFSSNFTSEMYLVCFGLREIKSQSKYIDCLTFHKILEKTYVRNNIRSEFERCKSFSLKKSLYGIPAQLVSSVEDMLLSIIREYTLNSYLISFLLEELSRSIDHCISFKTWLIFCFFCCSVEILHLRSQSEGPSEFPSYAELQKYLACDYSIKQTIAIWSNDLQLFQALLQYHNSPITFSGLVSRHGNLHFSDSILLDNSFYCKVTHNRYVELTVSWCRFINLVLVKSYRRMSNLSDGFSTLYFNYLWGKLSPKLSYGSVTFNFNFLLKHLPQHILSELIFLRI